MTCLVQLAMVKGGVLLIVISSLLIGIVVGVVLGFALGSAYRAATGAKYESLETSIKNLSLSIDGLRHSRESSKR